MEVEDEGERFAPYLFDVRPRPLQHSRMVALSKRLTVCLRRDKGEFGLEWTPQAMTPLEKVLSLRIMQERGAKLEEVLAVVYHSDKKRFRLGVIQGTLYIGACQGRSMEVEEDHVYTRVEPSEVPSIIHATCYDFYASILKTGIKPGGGNPRTRGHIHCLRDHVSQHRFFTVRWYLTDNGYFVTPDTIPAAAITAVTIIASKQRVSFMDHPPPAASIAMAMACAPSGSRAYMTSLPGEGMAPQCPVTSPSEYPPQDCHHRSRMATGGHLLQTLLSLAGTLALRIGLQRRSRACRIKRRWLCKRIRPGCYRRIRSTSFSDGPRINKPQSVTPEHVKRSCACPKSSAACSGALCL